MSVEIPRNNIIGARVPIRDAALKVTGSLRYTGDMKLPHMLHAKVLFSPVAHAKITGIDTSRAEKLKGVCGVVCYLDDPGVTYNANGEDKDQYPNEHVFDDTVRYIGDKVAAVAAETPFIAEQALKLIQVEYEELPVYLSPEEAMEEGAYPIHKGGNVIEEVRLSCGDVDQAMKQAYRIYEDTYTMPAIHHSAMETHVSVADYAKNGKLTIYTPTQDVFGQRENLHRIFGLPMNRIRVITPALGGGFGGKIDLITEPIAALLSMKTGRPVKLSYNRREEIASTRSRHGMKVTLKTGVSRDGVIMAQDVTSIQNAGAYTSCSMSVCWAMGGKLFKNHKTPNLRFRGIPVFTNTLAAGAMRGFGSPQLYNSQQCQMNQIASDLGIDMIDMQLKNLVWPGDLDMCSKEPHGNARPLDCVDKGMKLFGWKEVVHAQEESRRRQGRFLIGAGMAAASHGNGIYGVMPDTTGIILKVNEDGSAVLYTGVSDMGSGSITAQTQVVSEVLGIPLHHIETVHTDTDTSLWDLGAYSSRGIFVSCQAVKKVAEKVRSELIKEAAQLLKEPAGQLRFLDGHVLSLQDKRKSASLEAVVRHAHQVNQRDICECGTFANCATAMSYGAHFAKVEVDTQTGQVRVLEYTAVHDIGKAINPLAVEGQIEGAVQIGMGYALTESIEHDETGRVRNTSFKTYRLIKAADMPDIKIGLVEAFEEAGPFGAKSIGECAVVPSAGAIVNAVSNAVGKAFHQIPLKPEVILSALGKSNQNNKIV